MAVLKPLPVGRARGATQGWLALCCLAAGCGNISNQVFAEDANFLAAFPGDSLALAAPAGSTSADAPELLALSLAEGTVLNATLATVLGATDTIRSGPPASREDGARTWGAYEWENVDLSAAMQLTGGTRYDWNLSANASVFASGSHYAGKTVATGDGTFSWDETARSTESGGTSAGQLEVTYDSREGTDLLVTEERWTPDPATSEPTDATFSWTVSVALGDFQFRSSLAQATGEPIDALVHTRWIENVGGRSDAWLTGGSLEAEDVWTQCWDAVGALTYSADTLGLIEPLVGDGGEAVCALHDLAPADRI